MRQSAIVLLIVWPCAAQTPAAEELGRLFFTPQQRALLERGQQPDGGAPEHAGALRLDGIVQRHGGERTLWINGVPQRGTGDERAPESAPLAIPGLPQPLDVKVGQRIPLTPAGLTEQ